MRFLVVVIGPFEADEVTLGATAGDLSVNLHWCRPGDTVPVPYSPIAVAPPEGYCVHCNAFHPPGEHVSTKVVGP